MNHRRPKISVFAPLLEFSLDIITDASLNASMKQTVIAVVQAGNIPDALAWFAELCCDVGLDLSHEGYRIEGQAISQRQNLSTLFVRECSLWLGGLFERCLRTQTTIHVLVVTTGSSSRKTTFLAGILDGLHFNLLPIVHFSQLLPSREVNVALRDKLLLHKSGFKLR